MAEDSVEHKNKSGIVLTPVDDELYMELHDKFPYNDDGGYDDSKAMRILSESNPKLYDELRNEMILLLNWMLKKTMGIWPEDTDDLMADPEKLFEKMEIDPSRMTFALFWLKYNFSNFLDGPNLDLLHESIDMLDNSDQQSFLDYCINYSGATHEEIEKSLSNPMELFFLLTYALMGFHSSNEGYAEPDAGMDDFEFELDLLLKEMETAKIGYNVPEKMDLYSFKKISLVLKMNESIESIKALVEEEGMKYGAEVKISPVMRAELSGGNFEIVAITPEEQAVSKIEKTVWKWRIRPTEIGEHELTLALSALLSIDGETTPRSISTYEKSIIVFISPKDQILGFYKKNWQWLWATIIIPAVGFIIMRKRKKGNPS